MGSKALQYARYIASLKDAQDRRDALDDVPAPMRDYVRRILECIPLVGMERHRND